MELFGIGPLELAFIILLAIIIFGPKDIVKTSKSIGKSLNKLVRSETWKTINQTSRELKNLPNRLMRETGFDEFEKSTKANIGDIDATLRRSIEPPRLVDTPPGLPDQPTDPEKTNQITEPPKNESPE